MSFPKYIQVNGAGSPVVDGIYRLIYTSPDSGVPYYIQGGWEKINNDGVPEDYIYVSDFVITVDWSNGIPNLQIAFCFVLSNRSTGERGYRTQNIDSFLGQLSRTGNSPFFLDPAPTVSIYTPPVEIIDRPDLLPPNSTPQERALSKTVARAGEVPMQIKQVWNPQTCPVGILPWLAWALSVDDWSANWTEQQKRDAIAASVQVHRVKGTVGAVRRALQAIGYEVIVNEDTGTPYTFRLQVDLGESGGTEALYNEAERLALLSKNARSHLLGVDGLGQVRGTSRLQSIGIDGNSTRVWPDVVEEIESTYAQRILSAEHTIDNTRIRPEVLNTYSTSGDLAGGGAITYDLTVTL